MVTGRGKRSVFLYNSLEAHDSTIMLLSLCESSQKI